MKGAAHQNPLFSFQVLERNFREIEIWIGLSLVRLID